MRPIRLILLTPFYMVGQGALIGLVLGLLTGTLLIPVLGTVFGALWGSVVGGSLGGVLGSAYAVLLFVMRPDGVIRAQNRLRFVGSLSVGSLFSALNHHQICQYAHTVGEPCGSGYSPLVNIILIILIAISVIAAAYGTDSWLNWLRFEVGQKLKVHHRSQYVRVKRLTAIHRLIQFIALRTRWFLYLSPIVAIVVAFVHLSQYPVPEYSVVTWTLLAILAASGYVIAQTIALTLSLTLIIMVANRYLFTADTDPRIYKRNLSILTFCLVLPSQLVVAAVIGAPIAAVIATLAVRDYADWVHSPEKQKSKPKAPSQVTTIDVLDEAPIL